MKHSQSQTIRRRAGFTLVELVIVVLVLGIITAVAAPRMFDTAGDARDSATRQSLAVLRSAIELARAQNGSYPGAALGTTLLPFLQGPFPAPAIGNTNNNVATSTDNPIAAPAGTEGWIYNATTGELRVNHADGFAW